MPRKMRGVWKPLGGGSNSHRVPSPMSSPPVEVEMLSPPSSPPPTSFRQKRKTIPPLIPLPPSTTRSGTGLRSVKAEAGDAPLIVNPQISRSNRRHREAEAMVSAEPDIPREPSPVSSEGTPPPPPPPRVSASGSYSKTGRPRKHPIKIPQMKSKEKDSSNKPKPAITILTMSLPVTDRDEDIVTCSLCGQQSRFRQFRLHNFAEHYNLATTKEEEAEQPIQKTYRFYENRLREFMRIKKLKHLNCPNSECHHKFTSALGLACHLEECNKTSEEIEAAKLTCEFCPLKFLRIKMLGHRAKHKNEAEKKAKLERIMRGEEVEEVEESPDQQPRIRKSDRPRKPLTKIKGTKISPNKKQDEEDGDDGDGDYQDSDSSDAKKEKLKKRRSETKSTRSRLASRRNIRPFDPEKPGNKEIQTLAAVGYSHLEIMKGEYPDSNYNVCERDRPERNMIDPFPSLSPNPLTPAQDPSYLPLLNKSPKFRVETSSTTETTYNSLGLFEDIRIPEEEGREIFIANVGGPVISMAWHPSGLFLALSTLSNISENPPRAEKLPDRKASLQIWRFLEGNPLQFQLMMTLALEDGYLNHLQWGNFWPTTTDLFYSNSFQADVGETRDDCNKIGYLAYASQNSTCRILSVTMEDFLLPPNYTYNKKKEKIPIYHKDPEITLKVDGNDSQCVKFDWHEGNVYFAAGFGNGTIAIFDLEAESKLLSSQNSSKSLLTMKPIWVWRGHVQAVTCVMFDPSSPRYLTTASHDRSLKFWDVYLRMELEGKRLGMFQDSDWIRGFSHGVFCCDAATAITPGGQANQLKYMHIGCAKPVVSGTDLCTLTSVAYLDGMTASATENGRVSITYYDGYWREKDYYRNKRRKDHLVFTSKVTVENEDNELENLENVPDPLLLFNFIHYSPLSLFPEFPSEENFLREAKYYPYIRINKVAWRPLSQHLVTGYRSGLITITHCNFHRLFK